MPPSLTGTDARALLLASYRVALDAVRAEAILPPHLPAPPSGRTLVVGAGKAAADMAACVERHWPVEAPLDGVVITRHGHGLTTRRIRVLEAGHPLPDAAGVQGARTMLDRLAMMTPEDRVIALISGGGSSLLSLPVPGLDLADLAKVGNDLLRSGADIHEINIVRKHLSLTLGGRLAQATRAPVSVLMVSDVVGDDPSTIASGPFCGDPSHYADALAVIGRYRIDAPARVMEHLHAGLHDARLETPKPGDPCFARVEHRLLATGRDALAAAAQFFRGQGIHPVVLGDGISGEAREVARVFAALAHEIRRHGQPWRSPVVLLSGGETQVSVRGRGLGGRNSEFLLSLALALDGLPDTYVLAADSDGIDGGAALAGALIGPETLTRARALGIDGRAHLENNDSHRFFISLGDGLPGAPTRVNVNDYRALLLL